MDIKAASRLTKESVTGIVDLVEAVHYNITRLGGIFGNNKKQRTSGITGFVYNNVRSITALSGEGIELLVDTLKFVENERVPSPKKKTVISIINGVIGDYLVEKKNPLAIPMQLRYNGEQITRVDQIQEEARKKIVLLVHGSCMSDLQWTRKGHDHGSMLSQDFGHTPVYLLYNSGRHISDNGKELSEILEGLMRTFQANTELVILAHSMGGLLSRSAIHYGTSLNKKWVKLVKKLIFLGTPHHGAPLEKGGNWIDNMLDSNPFSAPLSRLGKIRSAGITDLRYGNILDEDWNGHDRFIPKGDQRTHVPLPTNVQCFAIAASVGMASTKLENELVGDGLVPISSALGQHKNPHLNLSFAPKNQWTGSKMNHLDLLSHPEVYAKIKSWVNMNDSSELD